MVFFINNQKYEVTIPSTSYSFWDIFDLLTLYETVCNAQLAAFGTWSFTVTGNNNKFVQITNSTNTQFRLVYDQNSSSRN